MLGLTAALVGPGSPKGLAETLVALGCRVVRSAEPGAASEDAADFVAFGIGDSERAELDALDAWTSSRRPGVPVVAFTRAGDAGAATAAREAGADDVLPWPCERPWLRARLARLAGESLLRGDLGRSRDVLKRLAETAERRRPELVAHRAGAVEAIAGRIARRLGFDSVAEERIRLGAAFHDVGTLAFPAELDAGVVPLGPEDRLILESHPVLGYELVRRLPSLEPVLPFVHLHHERLDGSGYPYGLAGSEIPFAVQVLSVADAFEALTSARPHRPARTLAEALDDLRTEVREGRMHREVVRALEAALEAALERTESGA